MNNIITVTTENKKKVKVEVIDIFQVAGYENKDYILYTQNIEVDKDNIKAYISILEEKDGNYTLKGIEDNKEWDDVQKALEEMEDIANE
jgi:uncharacterized protein YrzB (UPF0473 family)